MWAFSPLPMQAHGRGCKHFELLVSYMGARLVRGSVPLSQVVKRSVDSGFQVDWDIMDRLRDSAPAPDQLRSWYLGCDCSTQKRIRDHIVYKACALSDQETRAFDLVCALLDDPRISLGKVMLTKVCRAVLACRFASSLTQRQADDMLRAIDLPAESSGRFMPLPLGAHRSEG
jgi:hypothetical protein